jgi:hypothetical protein
MWSIGCQKRVGIFTLADVAKGTELTYDYNFEGFWQPGAALTCQCGEENCAGTLGGKKKTKESLASAAAAALTGKQTKQLAAKASRRRRRSANLMRRQRHSPSPRRLQRPQQRS